MLVAPMLLIGESMARGRGMVRGCGWAFAVLALEIGTALLFANAQMQAMALAPIEHSRSPKFLEDMRASMPPEQVEAFSEQVAITYEAMRIIYPAAYIISVAVIVLLNASLLRIYLRRRDPGWLDAGEFEGVRWPFLLAVAFVAMGLGVLSPLLRPFAYNGLLILAFFFGLQGLAVVVVLRPAPGRAAAAAGGGAGAGAHQPVGAADPGPHRPLRHVVRFPEMGRAPGDPQVVTSSVGTVAV